MEILKFSLSNLRLAFAECQLAYPNMAEPTKVAHKIFLSPEFWETNSKKIEKIVMHLKANNDELAIESLEGKIEKKLGALKFRRPTGMSNFDKALVSHTMAALLVELMLDNKIVTSRVNLVAHTDPDTGHVRKRNLTTIILGGTPEPTNHLVGYEDEPGIVRSKFVGFERLPRHQIQMDMEQASIPFKVSDVWTEERLSHFYKGSALYHAETKNEKRVKRHRRFNVDYMAAAKELVAKEKFYLPVNHCSRYRTYYDANALYGFRPQGKLFEVAMLDAYKPKLLGESAINTCKHIICDARYGKMTELDSVNRFSDEDYIWALEQDPLNVPLPGVKYSELTHDKFRKFEDRCGEAINVLKAARAIEMTLAGIPCHYMLGKDLTNSGLIMLASCSGSEQMLTAGNLMGQDCVNDSHTQFGTAQGVMHLGRRAVKEIHTPLLHGSSVQTIVKILHNHVENPDDFTVESVDQHNVEAYGIEVDNIDLIAAWGADVVTNTQNVLKWKTDDGLTAFHQAVMERTPFSVFAASTRIEGKFHKEYKIMATMPLALDRRGMPIFGRENTTAHSHKGTNVKTRGLFANLTHSIDGTLLRRITRMLLDKGESFLVKHDDYIVMPDMFEAVTKVCQEFFSYLRDNNLMQDALDQIADRLERYVPAPKLLVGNAPNKALESVNFLMP